MPTARPEPTKRPKSTPLLITLKKGDAVASLGNWKGTDYAGMQAPTGAAAKNTGMVRVYANQGAAKSRDLRQ